MSLPRPANDRWFSEHVLPHEPMLRLVAVGFPMLGDIDDLVPETYARVLQAHVGTGAPIASIKTFVFSTAHNLAIDLIRRQKIVGIDSPRKR